MGFGYSVSHRNLECLFFKIGCTNNNNNNQFKSNSKKAFKWALTIKDEELLAAYTLYVTTWTVWTIQADSWVSHSMIGVRKVSYASWIHRNPRFTVLCEPSLFSTFSSVPKQCSFLCKIWGDCIMNELLRPTQFWVCTTGPGPRVASSLQKSLAEKEATDSACPKPQAHFRAKCARPGNSKQNKLGSRTLLWFFVQSEH